ncbi:MAG TPA: hypothetical protein EYG94_02950 [Campylobacterales bacterium]|nr:hypothetical protein [Campylobacterales bacterium]
MLRQYKLITIAFAVAVLLAIMSYYYFKSEKLTLEVENQEVAIEIAKDEIKTEVLETKWETIAVEHNKSLGDKEDEIKEPVVNYDANTTDFFFFGMFP